MKDITPAPKPENTSHLRTLSNGAVYDMKRKRIVSNPGGGNKAFTSDTASAAVQIRIEQKRAAVARAANFVAFQGGGVDGRALTGDLAFVEAISESMTMKALTVNDPKAVDAARFIFQESGIAETKNDNVDPPADGSTNILVMMFNYIEQLTPAIESRLRETIEGEAEDV